MARDLDRRDLFTQRVREARKRARLTQREAAERLGKHQSFVSKIESGERRLDFLEVEDLAAIYGVRVSFFQTK